MLSRRIGDPTAEMTSANQPVPPVPPVSAPAARELWLEEVLGCSIRLLRHMPLPTTLVCAAFGVDVLLAPELTTYAYTFAGPEVDALALAAEHDRAMAPTLRVWLERKAAQPGWRLTAREAIGGLAGGLPRALGWSTERVLRRLGLELREVVL